MSLLAQPLALKRMQLRNRIVMLPMVTNLSSPEGYVTDSLVAHYVERARRDAGLVIVEGAAVAANARNSVQGVGIWDDVAIPGLACLAKAIKAGGAAAAIQLFHAGAKTHPGLPPVSSSGIALRPGPAPRALRKEELPTVVRQFAQAARRAVAAGFDAVEIHVAHLYLLSDFLSPLTNKRTDEYGGSAERRARLPVEVVRAVRAQVGPDYPIIVRMHGLERPEGGMTAGEARHAAGLLAEAGADAFDVSAINEGGFVETLDGVYVRARPYLAKDAPPGAAVPQAASIRQATGKPVIAVGKLGQREAAAAALSTGGVDMVGVGRGFLADPRLARKLLGRSDEAIVECRQCFTCLTRVIDRQLPIRCAVNERLGYLPV